jgi:hypothetical protein
MSQFTKNLELDSVINSGLTDPSRRTESTHFDQRRTLDASGVVVVAASSREYAADGIYGISDYYQLTVNATGILRVSIRNQNSCGDVIIVNSAGSQVLTASPSKYSTRATSVATTTINSSGNYYSYIQLKGRSGAEYRVGIDVTSA